MEKWFTYGINPKNQGAVSTTYVIRYLIFSEFLLLKS